jgi:hypothetical protein
MEDKPREDETSEPEEPAPAEDEWAPLPSRRRLRGRGKVSIDWPVHRSEAGEPHNGAESR